MTAIRLHRHPFEAVPPLHVTAPSIGEWLLAHYGERPHGEVHVYAGEPSRETDVTGDVPALMRNDAPLYVVLETPGATPIEWGTILTNLAVSTAISLVATAMFAPDPKPLDNRTQESPNNSLSARENRMRLLQRVEDIFGTVRAIPSLMMQTYVKYIQNRAVEYSLLCIGRGYYDVDDIRDGETLLSDIDGASARVYHPFTSPNSGSPIISIGDPIIDPVLNVTRSIGVEGIVLKAANQLQMTPALEYLFRGPGAGAGTVPVTTLDVIYQPTGSRRPNFAAVATTGQQVVVTMADFGVERETSTGTISVSAALKKYTASPANFFAGVVNGTTISFPVSSGLSVANSSPKTVVSHTAQTVTVAETTEDDAGQSGVTVSMVVNLSGTRTIDTVSNAYVTLTGASQYPATEEAHVADLVVDNDLTDFTGWITVGRTDRTELWTNVLARSGMFKDDGSKSGASVAYEVQIEQLDPITLLPTGTVETMTGTITGAASTEQAETLERVTAWTGPARVRARRTTPFDYDFAGFVQDEITWMDLFAVAPVTKLHFGNKTIIHTVARATPGATAVRRRELNCRAARLLPTFNGTTFSGAFGPTGALASGTIHPTSKIVDIIAAVTLDPRIGARAITDIDMAQIWATQQALDAWNTECGQFNYTFDSDEVSYEETVNAISRAAFCEPYRQNGQIRLALDRPQSAPVGVFTPRSKKPRSETITRKFASDSDYDGVELVYMDPETEKQETIRLPLDGSWTKLKKVEITGIRSYEQAWLHANREMQRLLYQRLTIETVVTTDARALLPNARVDIVDNTRFKAYGGEVLAQVGLELTLSRAVEFLPATPHSIVLKQRDGTPQAITVTAGSAANKVVLAAPPAEALVTAPDPDQGVRTEFSFAADTTRGAQAWLVQRIEPPEGGYMRLRCVNYAPEYYAADEAAIPAKSGVIN